MKRCIALVSVCVLFGCAARPHIECRGRDGNILYHGPYDDEKRGEFVVYVDDNTTDFYRKATCRKV